MGKYKKKKQRSGGTEAYPGTVTAKTDDKNKNYWPVFVLFGLMVAT